MISIYLASVYFPLTGLLWSKVSSYGTNPLTRDKETETASILLVTSPDLTIVLSSSWCGRGGGGTGTGVPQEAGWHPARTEAGSEGAQSAGHRLWHQPSCGGQPVTARPRVSPLEPWPSPPGTAHGLGPSPSAAAI